MMTILPARTRAACLTLANLLSVAAQAGSDHADRERLKMGPRLRRNHNKGSVSQNGDSAN